MILILYAILGTSCYLIPEGYNYLYGFVFELMLFLLLLKVFLLIDYKKPLEKSFAFCLLLWEFLNICIFAWIETPILLANILYVVQVILGLSMLFWCLYRSYETGIDKYSNKGVYIVFKTPKTFIDYLHSVILKPSSSVSIVINGEWYGYTLGKPYRKELYYKHDYDQYIKLKISAEKAEKELNKMLGARWNFTNNCCHAIQRLFKYNFSVWDSFPCVFAKTLKRIVKNGKC